MPLTTVKLKRRGICPCGEAVIKDDVPLGAEYQIDMATMRHNFTWFCGKCQGRMDHVTCVKATCYLHPEYPMEFIPYDLFRDPS